MIKHTISLEMSKKLKEAGFKTESESYYVVGYKDENGNLIPTHKDFAGYDSTWGQLDKWDAYSATELLDAMPILESEYHGKEGVELSYNPDNGTWEVSYSHLPDWTQNKLLPDALAEMILQLIEKGLL